MILNALIPRGKNKNKSRTDQIQSGPQTLDFRS